MRPGSAGVPPALSSSGTKMRAALRQVLRSPRSGYFTASLGKIFHRGLTIEDIKGEMDDPKSWDLRKYFVATARGKEGDLGAGISVSGTSIAASTGG